MAFHLHEGISTEAVEANSKKTLVIRNTKRE